LNHSRPLFRMKVELTVIDHLGLKMYVTLPPVISELIANCWDAEADVVDVSLPSGRISETSELIVSDDGIGMSADEINELYLRIGRDRRTEENADETPTLHRKIMGRKGIGKLSAFGVAKIVEIETYKGDHGVAFRMDIDKIRATPSGKYYEPEVIQLSSQCRRKHGTVVRLRLLKRSTPVPEASVRKRLARRFSILGSDFQVRLNGVPITPKDRLLKEDMEYTWDIDEEIAPGTGWRVCGWIGTSASTLDEEEKGIVVMCRGKLTQEPTFFDVTGGPLYPYAHMTGELHAEFFDQKEDLTATYRGSLIWESPEGVAFKEWALKKLHTIANEWSNKRMEKRERVVREDPEFKKWLQQLTGPEAKVANKVIKAIASDEKLSDERRIELAGYMKESFEFQVFRELAEALGENPADATLIELFEEWRVIEAREILRVAQGRLKAIKQFEEFVRTDAREVPTIHKYFAEYPWILDPSWTIAYDEAYYSELLRNQFPDNKLDERDRRIDFVCIGAGDTIHVVELKRPGHKTSWEDLDQLERYVAFVRARLGTAPLGRSYSDAAGYIVAGDVDTRGETREKIRTLERSRMYVKKYEDLVSMAKRLHHEFAEKLEKFEQRRSSRREG